MKRILFHILPVIITFLEASEPPIEEIPVSALGRKKSIHFKDVEWEAVGWIERKTAPVCEVIQKPLNLDKLKELSETMGLIANWGDYQERTLGPRSTGSFSYTNPKGRGTVRASPHRRYLFLALSSIYEGGVDENQMRILEPIPSKEEAIAICRKWLADLDIDEDLLDRTGSWPGGFTVDARAHTISGTDQRTGQPYEQTIGLSLRLAQSIGGLPAFWSGDGGNLLFDIADGGELCQISGQLRAWKKIGEFELLGKEDLIQSLENGYYWGNESLTCTTLVIEKASLLAYHADSRGAQKHFPLIYLLEAFCSGGQADGMRVNITIPALIQHMPREHLADPR